VGGKEVIGFFEDLSMKSVNDSSDHDEEVGVVVIPHVVFNDGGRGIRVNGRQGGVHNDLEVVRGRHNWIRF
jgi:hypothetical protein